MKREISVLTGLMLAAFQALALTIGDIEVKSAYGERFSARIPIALADGEDVTTACVRLEDAGSGNARIPMLTNYVVSLEQVKSGRSAIWLSTVTSMTEPAVRVALVVRCAKTSSSREFIVDQQLVDTKKK